jgi:alanyl-tRNA synthetase
MIYANVPKSKVSKIKAGEWVGEVCKVSGGKGGGKDNSASGQGGDVSKGEESIKFAFEFATKKLQ